MAGNKNEMTAFEPFLTFVCSEDKKNQQEKTPIAAPSEAAVCSADVGRCLGRKEGWGDRRPSRKREGGWRSAEERKSISGDGGKTEVRFSCRQGLFDRDVAQIPPRFF